MFEKLKQGGETLKREITTYQLILRDPRTPKIAKFLLGLAVAYVLSPVDIIPDFIPVIGHVDDIIIVPLIVLLALKFIPEEIIREVKSKQLLKRYSSNQVEKWTN